MVADQTPNAEPAPGPLARFRVLDLTRARAGPTAARQLADWGADVIKVERPDAAGGDGGLGGPRHGPDFQNLHRNKRAVTLDLKAGDGLALFLKLVEGADVVVENYRPDVKARLCIDYDSLRAVNASIVLASISGFGQDGPYVARPGVDQIAQGMGGLMSITGAPGQGPMRVGVPIADLSAGLFAAQGILIALLEREASGEGQWIRCSLLEAQIAMLDFQAARWTMSGEVAGQAGNNHPTGIPTGVFETSDGHINIASAGETIWRRFCAAIRRPQWADDEKYLSGKRRLQNRDELNEKIAAVTRTRGSAEWVALLNEAGVPCGPIYGIDETFADPQVRHLGIARTVENPALGPITLVGQAISMSRSMSPMRRAAPEKGEHNREVFAALGLSDQEIDALEARDII